MVGSAQSNPSTYEDIKDDKIYAYFNLNPSQRKEFSYTFTSSFQGSFVHPGVHCEAMYDASIMALEAGKAIQIDRK
ncbi:MAG: hypothetical protein ACPGYY_10355, partial [Bacteroidia bacterium]